MARLLFGGSSDDYAADSNGRPITGRRVRFYTSPALTTEITDLASDAAGTGAPLTVSTDSHGFWGPVYGPDAVTVMYAGTADPAGNPPTYVVAVYTHTQTGGSTGAGVDSFNTRTGAVTLAKADVTGTGLAAADVGADASGAAATAQAASLQKSANLSDVATAATARTNLGLGTAATQASTAFDAAGAAATAQAASLQKTSNLSDVANATTARGNLGAAATSHAHAEADVTSLTTDLAGKAAATHTHAEADVTSLTTDLTARVSKSTLSAKGSLFAGSAAGTPADVPVGTDGQQLIADSTQTAGVAWKSRSRSVNDTHTDVVATNTVADVVLASQAIPTTVGPGDIVRLTVIGDLVNNSGANVNYTFRVFLGATTISTAGAITINSNATRRSWRMEVDVFVVATNDQRVNIDSIVNVLASNLWNLGAALSGAGRGTATEDLTAGKNLEVHVQLGTATALADVTAHEAYLEVLKR